MRRRSDWLEIVMILGIANQSALFQHHVAILPTLKIVNDLGSRINFFSIVVSSNSGTVYWIYIFSHLFVVKIVFEKTKITEKEEGVGPLKKLFLTRHRPNLSWRILPSASSSS